MDVPGLRFKIPELILSLIAYCQTLSHYAFGYWEIFVSQIVVLGTFTILQSLIIMRFHQAPTRAFERVTLGFYGVLNIICALMLAYKIYLEKQKEDMEAVYSDLTCVTPDFTDELYMDFLWLFICNILLGILMIFDTLSM
ncbi:hypothetical protein CBL_14344 [Carabus blaptoides fortunei]